MKRRPKVVESLSAAELVMRLVPVGGWISKDANGGLTISDGVRRHCAGDFETLLQLIQLQPFRNEKSLSVEPPAEVTPLSPFSPSASRQTDQQPSASTEDSRDE